jgi:hypothetical protein
VIDAASAAASDNIGIMRRMRMTPFSAPVLKAWYRLLLCGM